MKKIILFSILLLNLTTAHAQKDKDWDNWLTKMSDIAPSEFNESALDLPPVPDVNNPNWFQLYINETHRGEAWILLDSVTRAPDNSIRYVLNQRSSQGLDNISAEGLLCITGYRLLGSEGSKVKTFAYADGSQWIPSRRAQWQSIGGKMNSTDRVRGVLHQHFCLENHQLNDEALRQNLRDKAGRLTSPQSRWQEKQK